MNGNQESMGEKNRKDKISFQKQIKEKILKMYFKKINEIQIYIKNEIKTIHQEYKKKRYHP